jgi:hypothetical protein
MRKQGYLSCVALLIMHKAIACVDIDINGTTFSYEAPQRLSTLLAPVAHSDNWYWQSSSLFEPNNTDILSKKRDVLAQLKLLQEKTDDNDLASDLAYVYEQISQWQVARRIHLDIDYDAARLNIQKNPEFACGQYSLYLQSRPAKVHFIGLAERTSLPTKPMSIAKDYIFESRVKSSADPDFVYVISPTGELEKRGVAYWNTDHHQIIPGSQIYVPFFENRFIDTMKELNLAIVELAVNRVFPHGM